MFQLVQFNNHSMEMVPTVCEFSCVAGFILFIDLFIFFEEMVSHLIVIDE